MIDKDFVVTMARYNAWQNQSLYKAASSLSDEVRKMDRGAFFKSIHGTLCHILWGDQIWLNRFAGSPPPSAPDIANSPNMIEQWDMLCDERTKFDAVIQDWALNLEAMSLEGELTWYSGALNRQVSKPIAGLIVHLFNHQTHHRGQAHAMITSQDVKPDDTDIFVIL